MVLDFVFKIGEILFDKSFNSFIDALITDEKKKKLLLQIEIAVGDFDTKFDNSALDTRSFYNFLNEDFLVKEYFGDLFWKGKSKDDKERLDSIVQDAIGAINKDREKIMENITKNGINTIINFNKICKVEISKSITIKTFIMKTAYKNPNK